MKGGKHGPEDAVIDFPVLMILLLSELFLLKKKTEKEYILK